MSRPAKKTPGDVYRAAARALERGEDTFPCIAVGHRTPGGSSMDWHWNSTLAGKFILTMAPKGPHTATSEASDAYLTALAKSETEKPDWSLIAAHSILALCFAAAMADTGDLT